MLFYRPTVINGKNDENNDTLSHRTPLHMSTLEILQFPDPRLLTVAKPIAQVDERIKDIAARMLETMYESNGVGLAATQVNVHERMFVMDTTEERNQPLVLINPELTWVSEEKTCGDEGCLSIPGIYDSVERHASVHVKAQDEHGQWRTIEATGLQAVCIQHEMDHLMGKLFVDYLSPLKRNRIKSKMLKRAKG